MDFFTGKNGLSIKIAPSNNFQKKKSIPIIFFKKYYLEINIDIYIYIIYRYNLIYIPPTLA